MNTRIQELFSRAGGAIAMIDGAVLTYTDHFDPAKFAELIVRECVQILDDFGLEHSQRLEQPAHHPGLNFLVSLKIVEAAWKIKTDFGIEE